MPLVGSVETASRPSSEAGALACPSVVCTISPHAGGTQDLPGRVRHAPKHARCGNHTKTTGCAGECE